MNSKKDSGRVRMTKKLLRQALTQLLMEKPIQNITVRELCERAQVNRGTFYVHYSDIYALMEAIEEQMVSELAGALEGLNASLDHSEGLLEPCQKIFELLKQNADMCIILLGKNSDFTFVNRLVLLGKETSLKQYMECYPKADKKQAEYFYNFVSSGWIGLLRQWADNDFADSPASIALMAQNLMSGASKALMMPVDWTK